MEKRIYTAGGIKIEVDKHEDKKAKERRMMAYAFKMIREESGMNRKDFADWLGIPDNAGMGTGKKSYATICT